MSLIERPEKPRSPHTPPVDPKPTLAMIQLPIYRVRADDLEDYLYEIYHIDDFDFLAAMGVVPGECPEFNVQPCLPPAITSTRRADAIRSGQRSREVGLILNVLCQDGYIPAGKYLVDTTPRPRLIDVYTSMMKAKLDVLGPECVAFKKAHRSDKLFQSQAEVVDQVVIDCLREEKAILGK